jgi:hypothetical protein
MGDAGSDWKKGKSIRKGGGADTPSHPGGVDEATKRRIEVCVFKLQTHENMESM